MRFRGVIDEWRGSWGWLRPVSGGYRVWLHWKSVETDGHGDLSPGDEVEFEYEIGDRGPRAVKVVVIQPAAVAATT